MQSLSGTGVEIVDWLNNSICHEPTKAIIGNVRPQNNDKETRIINMGMPKSGSSSVTAMFKESGMKVSHWTCKNDEYCGKCISAQIQQQNETSGLFKSCGDYHVWAQLDYQMESTCVYPQIQYMEELYRDAPDATWIMPMRNVSNWLHSVNKWGDMRGRFQYCDFLPHLNFTYGDNKSDEKMMELYCSHIEQVRSFVKAHPTLSYIEFRIEDLNVDSYLKEFFPSLKVTHWKKKNVNKGESSKKKTIILNK